MAPPPPPAGPGPAPAAEVAVALPAGSTRRALVDLLKRHPGSPATHLAGHLGITGNAVRQHLEGLEEAGLVERRALPADGPGRPPVGWHLTPDAGALFPDAHGELAVALLDALSAALGTDALDQVIAARVDAQEVAYRAELDGVDDLRPRVEALAARRSAEGYEAEVADDGAGLLLVEHHCPIRAAAHACGGLCGGELELFRRVLGPAVAVERTEHIVGGDSRCAYRISPAGPPAAARRR